MLKIQILFFFIFFLLNGRNVSAQVMQENYKFTYFGISLSPIIPSNIIQKNDFIVERDSIIFEVKQKPSFVFGMEVKHDFTRFFAVQTGINFAKRIYDITATEKDTVFHANLNFIGYEIPVLALGFVRITKNFYLDLSAGGCLNFYPSDIVVPHFYGRRYRWAQTSLLLNLGLEFRHETVGNFYLGILYQYHDKSMMTAYYYRDDIYGKANSYAGLSGNYLSINLKYYFPQNPEKSKNKEGQ